MTPPFGRSLELERLGAALARAASARTQFVGLVGEAGIGKTTLADHFTSIARRDGFDVGWGRCWEAGGAPAFWPWSESLRALGRPDVLRALLETHPDVSFALDAPPEPPSTGRAPAGLREPEGPQRRFALFASFTRVLRALAVANRTLLVLDDLHASDAPSVALLHFLARSLRDVPLIVVATWRPAEARANAEVAETLAKFSRDAELVTPAPLDRNAVAEILAAHHAPLDAGFVDEVARVSDGNPLFATELARVARSTGGRATLSTVARAQPGIRDAVSAATSLLAESARTSLAAAAVYGRPFDAETLSRLASTGVDAAHECIEAGRSAEVLIDAATTNPATRVRFAHELVRESVAATLSPRERAEIHARAVAMLEARHTHEDTPLSEIVHHAYLAIPCIPPLEVVTRARRAAAAASASLASESVVSILQRAIDVHASAGGEALERAAMLLDLAWALFDVRSPDAARAAATKARAIYDGASDIDGAARAALALAGQFRFGRRDEDEVAMLRQAIASIGPHPSLLRAQLLARLATALLPTPDLDEIEVVVQDALDCAIATGDPNAELTVFSVAPIFAWTVRNDDVEILRRLVGMAERAGRRNLLARIHARLALMLLMNRRVDSALLEIEQIERVVEQSGEENYYWAPSIMRSTIESARGNFASALQWRERGLTRAAAAGVAGVDSLFAIHEMSLAMMRGDLDALGRHRARFETALRAMPVAGTAYVGVLAATLNDRAAAAAVVAAHPEMKAGGFGVGEIALSRAVVFLGDRVAAHVARDRLAQLRTVEGHWGIYGIGYDGPVEAVRAAVAELLGHHEEADRFLDAALDATTVTGFRTFRARILVDRAAMRLSREGPDEASIEVVRDSLREADALAHECGLLDVPARVADLSAKLASIATASPARGAVSAFAPVAAPELSLARDGADWRLTFGPATLRVRDAKGVQYLDVLLRSPGREFHVLQLVGLVEGGPADATPSAGDAREAGDDGGPSADSNAGAVLDAKAQRAYRERLGELAESLEEAQRWNDLSRASKVQLEIDAIAEQLAAGVGLGGRARVAGSNAERARMAVQKRIRDAIQRVEKLDATVGRYLEATIRTGVFCAYEPLSGG